MSKYTLIKTIQMELEKLNMEIDLKIIKGIAYGRESRRHRFLASQLSNLSRPKSNQGWIEAASQMVSMFIL